MNKALPMTASIYVDPYFHTSVLACFESLTEATPWLTVDLGGQMDVSTVVIFSRDVEGELLFPSTVHYGSAL